MRLFLEKAIPYHSSEGYTLFVKQVYLAKGGEIWLFPWITACGMDEVRTSVLIPPSLVSGWEG